MLVCSLPGGSSLPLVALLQVFFSNFPVFFPAIADSFSPWTAGKKRAREEDATKKESDTEEKQEKMEGVKEPETPAVEDAKTPTVEDTKTPAVEDPKTPTVEDPKTPAVADTKGATNASDSVPNSQEEEPAESQAY